MRSQILKKLHETEAQYDIRILFACESGSRGWGFPSPDSDYDVRFIYTRPVRDYLSVQTKKDHLDFPINDELDIYGWDLSKVLHLIAKSNTTPFEWLQSPVIYHEEELFRKELWALCQHYFCSRSNIHHYLGISKGAMETMLSEEIKIKKLFYVLRPLLAALWCVQRETIAPMSIFPLMELMSENLQKQVLSLIELKSTSAESYMIRIDEKMKQWIDETFDYCSKASKGMQRKTFDLGAIDTFFRKTIMIR